MLRCALRASVLVALLAANASAQSRAAVLTQPLLDSGRRLALIIGNETYPSSRLKNPGNDARAMKVALTEAGFQADVVTDVTFREMSGAIDLFISKIRPGDVALFFYSGHGIQIDGENYLLPIDFAARDEADARYTSYSASRILDRMTGTGARMKVLVLDACRSNPFRMSRDLSGGLAAMSSAGRGSLIAFAAGPGGTADDNVSGSNGLFTLELLKTMRERGLGIEQVFARVRSAVDQASDGRQTPWTNSSLIGDFYFHSPSASPALASAPVLSTGTLPPTALAVLRGTNLATSYNWSATSIDVKAPGAEVAARREVQLALERLLSKLGMAVTFFDAPGIFWSDPAVDLTAYIAAQSWQSSAANPVRPQGNLTPIVRLGYVDLQSVADRSKLGQSLRAQVVANGSTEAQQQSAMETFQRAFAPLLERVSRARGVQLLFRTGDSGPAYADAKLDLSADFIAALDDPAWAARMSQGNGAALNPVGVRVRYVNLPDIVSRSRLGREYTAQVAQATARKASQDEIAKLSARLQEDFQRVLSPIVDKAAKAAGLRMVFTPEESGLIWSDKSLDFSDVIVRDLDAATPAGRPGTGSGVPPPPLPAPVRVGGNIKAPTQLKDVRPEYPAIAQSARVQGNVILEATIGTDGRVQEATVLRSIPLLDAAAISAVKQWEYTPTLLNGVPVPVIMTVTVSFTLR